MKMIYGVEEKPKGRRESGRRPACGQYRAQHAPAEEGETARATKTGYSDRSPHTRASLALTPAPGETTPV